MKLDQLVKIVSGGQTGVDRAGLDAAIALGIDHGGWCPRGRRAEDGRIPDSYQLKETPQRDYSVRTEQNVVESDGTLILYRRRLSGGTALTFRLAQKHNRPCCRIDLEESGYFSVKDGESELTELDLRQHSFWEFGAEDSRQLAGQTFLQWLTDHQIGVLNVAGPRESSAPGIAGQAKDFIFRTLRSSNQ